VSATLPDGFRSRRPVDGDVDIVARIIRAEEQAVRGDSTWGVSETSQWWQLSNHDDGTWIVETERGAPAAFAATIDSADSSECWAAVLPEFRGRGLATALIGLTEQRARARGFARVKVGAFVENDLALRLFDELGYREVRHYLQMRVALDGQLEEPRWPPGINVATFRREDARAFHAAFDEAFAEEWDFHSLPFDEWKAFRLEREDVDLSLWFVAWDGVEIAAVCRCERQHGGGWIGGIGVRKPWRRRGIGLALLQHAFLEFARRGEPHVSLGVDAENPTGATVLYERAGMRVVTDEVVFEKDLT